MKLGKKKHNRIGQIGQIVCPFYLKFFGKNTFPQSFYGVLKKSALFRTLHFRNLVTLPFKT